MALEELSVPRAPAAGLERWFAARAPAGAALRARIRARRLRVLPSERYKELAEFLTFHYARPALELALSAQAKEELAAAMVRVPVPPAGSGCGAAKGRTRVTRG